MKTTNVLKSLTLGFFVCILSLSVEAQIPAETPSARQMARRFLKYGKVEILESKMEKIDGLGDGYGGIRITGTAEYTPARMGKTEFKDLSYSVRFDLLSERGLKVRSTSGLASCGENGQDENVEYNEEFPFVYEDRMIPLDDYNKIADHKFDVWYILQ